MTAFTTLRDVQRGQILDSFLGFFHISSRKRLARGFSWPIWALCHLYRTRGTYACAAERTRAHRAAPWTIVLLTNVPQNVLINVLINVLQNVQWFGESRSKNRTSLTESVSHNRILTWHFCRIRRSILGILGRAWASSRIQHEWVIYRGRSTHCITTLKVLLWNARYETFHQAYLSRNCFALKTGNRNLIDISPTLHLEIILMMPQ